MQLLFTGPRDVQVPLCRMLAESTGGFLESCMEDGCEDTGLEEDVVDTYLDRITFAVTNCIDVVIQHQTISEAIANESAITEHGRCCRMDAIHVQLMLRNIRW